MLRSGVPRDIGRAKGEKWMLRPGGFFGGVCLFLHSPSHALPPEMSSETW